MHPAPRYPIPAETARVEMEVERSRFLSSGAFTPTQDEAQAFLRSIRQAFKDATHHCTAWRIGYGASVTEWASDDGEPSGTAGRPILSVLQGRDLGDVTVVVTRYFGGIKLGTGGLVRAYTAATQLLLDHLPTSIKVPRVTRLLSSDYPRYTRVKQALLSHEAILLHEDFGADISVTFTLPLDQIEPFDRCLTELSHGTLIALDLGSPDVLPPLPL